MYIHVYTRMNLDDFTAVLLIVIGVSLGFKHCDRCTTGPQLFRKVRITFSKNIFPACYPWQHPLHVVYHWTCNTVIDIPLWALNTEIVIFKFCSRKILVEKWGKTSKPISKNLGY